jgi:uncharacterized protein YndB with AHSA1/START domain
MIVKSPEDSWVLVKLALQLSPVILCVVHKMRERTTMQTSVKARIRLNVPADKVWSALTEKEKLEKWFCERASLDLEKGGSYGFGGRFTWLYREGDSPHHEILQLTEGETLSYRWSLRDWEGRVWPSTVGYRLTPEDDGTLFELSQMVNGEGDRPGFGFNSAWGVYLQLLEAHCEGRTFGTRFDFSRKPRGKLRHQVSILAPREKVFETISTVEAIKKTFTRTCKLFEAKPGGSIDMGWEYETRPTKVLDYDPPFLLSHNWLKRGEKGIEDGRVVWKLKREGKATIIRLTESGFSGAVDLRDDDLGWATVLNDIKRYCETGRSAMWYEITVA